MNLPPPFVPDETVLHGVGASAGIAIGVARVFSHKNLHIPDYRLVSPLLVEAELARLEKAMDVVRLKLAASKDSLPPELQSQAGIIDAHLLLLDDPLLIKKTHSAIKDDRRNAEQAVIRMVESVSVILENVADEYISSRLNDVEMVAYSIIAALLGQEAGGGLPETTEGSILVVQDISPAEVAKIASAKIAGLVTESGGHTSHTAIVAQALELPAVVGVKSLLTNINDGDTIIMDGRTGHVIVRPDEDALNFYTSRQRMELSFNAEIVRCSHLPAVTLDDHRINIMGNLELVEELPAIISYGSEGVGLYRTEFMYLNRKKLPAEKDLFEAYRRVVESAAPNPVVIRTLDVGYDKMLDFGPQPAGPPQSPMEMNQALGLRGIRYCLRNRPLFKTQLRAILRASVYGDVRIMLPMVSGVDELRKTRNILAEAERSLEAEGLQYAPRIPLGVMIEVPATIFVARELAEEAAFFSVGTNDLIQYTLAVDRGNPDVTDMYQPFHPAILRMLKTILEIGRDTATPVSICGDMAAGEVTAPILVGLGADTLSMPPAAIPKIKRLIRMSSLEEMRAWASDALGSRTATEALAKATRHVRKKFPELYQ
ncbi:phosphoenolpyruvate--protein phosphotransferase [Deltaproteobacteria bacterium OttesenSCG-928-M10]|nr:phosphoenolpyruvate--protein phosphotransferase [Deltaproteobacteria bacterium OttesenSCG-928-M10]